MPAMSDMLDWPLQQCRLQASCRPGTQGRPGPLTLIVVVIEAAAARVSSGCNRRLPVSSLQRLPSTASFWGPPQHQATWSPSLHITQGTAPDETAWVWCSPCQSAPRAGRNRETKTSSPMPKPQQAHLHFSGERPAQGPIAGAIGGHKHAEDCQQALSQVVGQKAVRVPAVLHPCTQWPVFGSMLSALQSSRLARLDLR